MVGPEGQTFVFLFCVFFCIYAFLFIYTCRFEEWAVEAGMVGPEGQG